jgi:hypothetical protein
MFQTTRRLHGRFAAFGATLVALHSQLIFALPGNGQMSELVFNAFSHDFPKAVRTSILCQSSIRMTESPMRRAELTNAAQIKNTTSRTARCQFWICAKRIEN